MVAAKMEELQAQLEKLKEEKVAVELENESLKAAQVEQDTATVKRLKGAGQMNGHRDTQAKGAKFCSVCRFGCAAKAKRGPAGRDRQAG